MLATGMLALQLVQRREPLRAVPYLRRALEECPDEDTLTLSRLWRISWHIHAYTGEWIQAFRDLERAYRCAWRDAARGPCGGAPLWNGRPLAGPLAVLAEADTSDGFGGQGDILLFSRYLRSVASRANGLMLALRPSALHSLGSLLGRMGCFEIVAHQDVPRVAAWLPLELTPKYATAEPIPYLRPFRVRRMNAVTTVALAWAGAVRDATLEQRTVPVSAWTPIRAVSGTRLVSVQQRRSAPARWAGPPIEGGVPPPGVEDRGPQLRHWIDTAAVLCEADLVITSDSAVAHLAGALGRPVWILLAVDSAPYWELTGERTRWYPTARLFRQRQRGDWSRVMADVAEALQALTHARRYLT